MPKDSLKDFAVLRHSLETERERISARLRAINAVLGAEPVPASKPVKVARAKRVGRVQNGMSLKEAIVKVTKGNPLTKDEIYQAVTRLGYRFKTDQPLKSINVTLYGKKPKFRNQYGRFSPA